ncbi:RHS repeat-associated core domain-containing protein [Stenotrophomonas sp.]|uniref:RHS repeat domain-containing protein n=1 Tax=Stenotrophomonas sp. TaxID=69392 RepID=UPI0028A2A89C|nr:RHS repeat-associated core domain-containing protein [Stenotrophomonas sp.]
MNRALDAGKLVASLVGAVLTVFGVAPRVDAAEVVEYIHTDALGSPVAVTNASGVVIERTVYGPYGEVINRPLAGGPGYTGHVEDAETGLNYMQQRYYEPEVGRFLSVDPVTAYNNPIGQFNRYRYADSNPYRFVDPDGRMSSMADHPGIPTGSVQGINQEPGQAAAAIPKVESKSIAPRVGKDEKPVKEDVAAVSSINYALGRAKKRVEYSKDAGIISSWNSTSWRWDPENVEFLTDPGTGAFVDPGIADVVFLGFGIVRFSDPSVAFSYHNASFAGGSVAMTFAILHEFGHVHTAGQGSGPEQREPMANSFAYGMLSSFEKRSIKCATCK